MVLTQITEPKYPICLEKTDIPLDYFGICEIPLKIENSGKIHWMQDKSKLCDKDDCLDYGRCYKTVLKCVKSGKYFSINNNLTENSINKEKCKVCGELRYINNYGKCHDCGYTFNGERWICNEG